MHRLHRVAVAQAGEHIQRLPRLHLCHLGRPLPHNFIDDGHRLTVIVADGDGAAQELALQGNVHKLARRRNVPGVPCQHHTVHAGGQWSVFFYCKNTLFIHTLTPRLW